MPISNAKANAVLCYVEEDTAYFTTASLAEQWGDDWDDAPYECNAGTPYEAHRSAVILSKTPGRLINSRVVGKTAGGYIEISNFDEKGEPYWQVFPVKFHGDFQHPSELEKKYCVRDINKRKVPWLQTEKGDKLYAGTTYEAAAKWIRRHHGAVLDTSDLDNPSGEQEPPMTADDLDLV